MPNLVRTLFVSFVALFATTAIAAERERLLIVTPKQFVPVLEKFVKHKVELLDAEVKTLEDILSSSEGVDDAEKLKRFLYFEHRERDLDFVLLVGDVDVMPVRYMTLDRKQESAFNYSFYPSDLYYADLAKSDGSFEDWNAQKDSYHAGYFGEVRGETNKEDPINFDQVDYQPDVAVGRWPVSAPEEVERIADKTIRYEKAVLGDRERPLKAGLVSVGGWIDSRPWMDGLAEKLGKGWEFEKRYFSDRRRRSGTPKPTNEEVRGLFNGGMNLIVHAGHGQNDQWEQCLAMPDLDAFTNADSLPIVVSAGCSTANFAPLPPYTRYVDVDGNEHKGTDRGEKFDVPPPPPANYQTGKYNPTGLGEQLLKRSEHGAVAYIGCNTGSQPCGLTLVEGFIVAVADAKEPRLGTCWSEAVKYYYDQQQLATIKPDAGWYPPSIFFQPMKFMLFGDPSLRMAGK